ncbi:hypothetical protein FACS1894172_04700 [Spirochaetia bacterium]|nr:hypothetical protein FACS1894172_04700 [Spirochaetia bacterium]
MLPGQGELSLTMLGMIHGKQNVFAFHNTQKDNLAEPNLQDTTPSGNADEQERTFQLSLRGNWIIPQPLQWLNLSVWAEFDVVSKTNKSIWSLTGTGEDFVYHKPGISHDIQFSLGLGIKL